MLVMIFKELRQLLPIAWLWLAVIAMGFASRLIGSRADEESFASWYDTYLDVGSDPLIAAVAALVGLVTAWSLFPREIDDSTIDFLRALPVSRLQVFVAKYLAAVALISGLVVFSYSIDALLLAWNPESMGGVFYTQVFFTLLWRDIVFSAVIVAHGVLISWFRVTGLVVYVIYLLAVAWLESRAGGAGVFSVLSMLSNEYYGSRLVVNVEAIVVHVLAAFCMLVIAHLLWSKTASARSGGKQRTRVGSFWRALVPIAAFLGLGATLLTITANEQPVSMLRALPPGRPSVWIWMPLRQMCRNGACSAMRLFTSCNRCCRIGPWRVTLRRRAFLLRVWPSICHLPSSRRRSAGAQTELLQPLPGSARKSASRT